MPNAEAITRIARYGVSGILSALAHFTVGMAATVLLAMPAVPASTIGFLASVAVSYVLQRTWVFRSGTAHTVTGPRFLTVTATALGLNIAVLWAGVSLLGGTFPVVQAVAILLIPGLNYLLHSRWTFT